MAKQEKKGMGCAPVCDFCHKPITDGTFIDGKTGMGPWARGP